MEETIETTIPVYPNPANDKVVIGIPPAEYYTVQIYTSDGKLVSRYFNESEIPVNNLEAGIYFIEILTGEKMSRQKLVIAR